MKSLNAGRIFIFWISLCIFLVGCGHTRATQTEKKFTIHKSWARHTVEEEYLGSRINHTMSPIVSDNLLVVGNEIDGITAYSRKWGWKKWSRKIAGGITAPAKKDGDTLYFGAGDGFFYAIDIKTGTTKWSFPLRADGIGAPLITDKNIYFISGSGNLYSLKKETGEQVWVYTRQDPAAITVRGASEPSVAGNVLYAGFSDGYLAAVDRTKGSLLWERQIGTSTRFRDVDSKPVIDGDKLYISSYDGQLYCLSIKNGEQIWVVEEGGFNPVTLSGNTLYYSTSTSKVLAINKLSGTVIWAKSIKGSVATQPTLYRGLLLYGEMAGSLRALNERTGEEVTSYVTGRGVTAMPTIDAESGFVYLTTADANVFALKLALNNDQHHWPWEK